MAEEFLGSTPHIMDNAGTSGETELVPSMEGTENTATSEGMCESFECSPTSSNDFLELEAKTTQKSLYTEIMEATKEGSSDSDSVLSEGALDINAIVGKFVGADATSVTDDTTDSEQCNLIAASFALERSRDEPTTSSAGAGPRQSMTETQLSARRARDAAEEAEAAATAAGGVVEIIREMTRLVELRMSDSRRTLDVGGIDSGKMRDLNTVVDECRLALKKLDQSDRRITARIAGCELAASTARTFAAIADEVTDEESDGGRSSRFNRCYRKSLTEEAIIRLYRAEYTALRTIKRLWVAKITRDQASDSSGRSEYTQQCDYEERKMRIVHAVGFPVGITVLGMSALFKVTSDSSVPILIVGGLTTLYTIGYWINQLRVCIKRKMAETTVADGSTGQEPDFMQSVNRRFNHVERFLVKRNQVPSSDEESGSGSSETVRAEDVSAYH